MATCSNEGKFQIKTKQAKSVLSELFLILKKLDRLTLLCCVGQENVLEENEECLTSPSSPSVTPTQTSGEKFDATISMGLGQWFLTRGASRNF